MSRPLITFTSDFGSQDWFVGVVRGVIHQISAEARVVDLTHTIPPGHVARAAFIIEAAAPDFPPGTVHLAVVDPGVGTDRKALAVRAHGQYFVGPDNGVLEWAFCDPAFEAHALTDDQYFRKPVSRTFHGRDVFAPVAAHLASGVPLTSFGPKVARPNRLDRPTSRPVEGELEGRVMFIDRFGNALTNLRAEEIGSAFGEVPERDLLVRVGSMDLTGIARSYGDAPLGTPVAIMGSSGRLEIATVGGDVAMRYGIGEGDRVRIRAARNRPPR